MPCDKLLANDYRAMQEMEAVLMVCAEYATGESQSNSSNNSLIPWYRKMLLKSAYQDEYDMMALSRQPLRTMMNRWPRVKRKVRNITQVYLYI